MRILIANDGVGDAGGVQTYIDAIVTGLSARGHDLVILHCGGASASFAADQTRALAQLSTADEGSVDAAVDRARRWGPDLCLSQNMSDLDVEARLSEVAPVIKFMHGYFGTCVSGQKRFAFPTPRPCARVFGLSCVGLYLPRRCGQLDVARLVDQYRWSVSQRDLFPDYRAIVVASAHMRREYIASGVKPEQVHVNPLFPTHGETPAVRPAQAHGLTVAFMGRMTALKGGDLLIRAVFLASVRAARPIRLTMIGDGPQRGAWERLAGALGVNAQFVGWQRDGARWPWLRTAHLLAVPSTWPEPFGLVGLEAAALGVPAIAFDLGGIREWLRPEENGYLVPGDPPSVGALADGLVRALRHPDELAAMGRRAVEVAREMSLDRHLERLEQLFAHPACR